jgi:hypothetical protein
VVVSSGVLTDSSSPLGNSKGGFNHFPFVGGVTSSSSSSGQDVEIPLLQS